MALVNTPPDSVAVTERVPSRTLDQVRWSDRRLLASGVVVVLTRFVFAADRRVFHLFADEPGQLAMARWLSGGTRWTMLDHNTWRPGYAMVLAPFVAVFDSGEAMVRIALVINAVFAGLTAIVLARLVQRWSGLGVGACATIAAVTALAPAAIASSAYTWSESLITLLVVTTIWFLQRFIDAERLSDALLAIAFSGFALTTHGRAATLLPTTVLICGVVLAHRARHRDVAIVVATAAPLLLASQWFTRWVHRSVWDELNGANSTAAVIERLDAPIALVDSTTGQLWYQLVASVGMVGVGVAWAMSATFRSRPPLDRRSAAVLLLTTLPPIALSITFMSDRTRPDQLVYGRYVDTVVWPFCALGLAVVVRRLRSDGRALDGRFIIPAVAATMVATALAASFRHGDELVDGIGLRMMVPGLLPYVGRGDGIPVLTITAVALLLLAVVSAVGRGSADGASRRTRRTIALGGLCLVVVSFSAIRVHDALAMHLNSWAIGGSVAEIEAIVPAGEPIGLIADAHSRTESHLEQRQRYQVYQLYLPGHEMVWLRDADAQNDPPSEFVMAPSRNAAMLDADATVVWRDPEENIQLWQVP